VQTRKIGSLEVTVIGLGTNSFGFGMEAEQVPRVVDVALDVGINFFDTADSYDESEVRLGQALGRRRDQVLIATKFGYPIRGEEGTGGANPDYVRRALEGSLRRLGTDRIDLYQLHIPDPEVPIAATLAVLDEAVRAGKIREIGCSNFSADRMREAEEATSGARFVSVQNHYNLLNREDEVEVVPLCEQLGISHLPYFPLASGLLTGKYSRGREPAGGTRLQGWARQMAEGVLTEDNFDQVEALGSWAERHEHTILDLAFAYLLAQKTVSSVIAGATKPSQVQANAAAGTWQLSNHELDEVRSLLDG